MLSGRPVPPMELLRLGVVANVVDEPSQLLSTLDAYILRLNGCAPRAAGMCKELVRLAWVDGGGENQAKGIEKLFTEMMAEDAEAAYGVTQFQAVIKSVDWAAYAEGKVKAKL